MPATLLTVVQEVARRLAIPSPTTVLGSTDFQVLQLYSLLQEGLDALSDRGRWEGLINEATWVTTATEDQGAITTLASNGYRYLLPETLWDRTEMLPLLGPVSPSEWQALKAIVLTGPRYSFRLRRGKFIVTPAPPAGHTWAFEYASENYILAADGTTYKKRFTLDTDTILLPEQIVEMDLRWRWKREKGLDYAEDFNTAERMIVNAIGRDGSKRVLFMDERGDRSVQPGIFVPSGSWIP